MRCSMTSRKVVALYILYVTVCINVLSFVIVYVCISCEETY